MDSEAAPVQVLLIEDDDRLAGLTERYLATQNMLVTRCADVPSGLAEALRHRYDVVLLDIMLPGGDGLELCAALRERSDVPIIMVSARGSDDERVHGIELGADDYLPTPFNPRELQARIRALVRRERGQVGPSARTLKTGPLELDGARMVATLEGRDLGLTQHEFALLFMLAEQLGRPVSRERLLDRVHRGSAEEAFERSIDVHVSRLRRKLGEDPQRPRRLLTVRGEGYMLSAADQD